MIWRKFPIDEVVKQPGQNESGLALLLSASDLVRLESRRFVVAELPALVPWPVLPPVLT